MVNGILEERRTEAAGFRSEFHPFSAPSFGKFSIFIMPRQIGEAIDCLYRVVIGVLRRLP